MQKNKKYWLRGGLIGLLVLVISLVVIVVKDFVFLGYLDISLTTPMWEQDFLGVIQNISGLKLLDNQIWWGITPTTLGKNIVYAAFILGPFIIGSLIGWLYGKTKNRHA